MPNLGPSEARLKMWLWRKELQLQNVHDMKWRKLRKLQLSLRQPNHPVMEKA